MRNGDGKPRAQGDDEDCAAEQGGCNDHDNWNPGRGRDRAEELDDWVNPVADALAVATGNTGDQTDCNTDEVAQEEQAQGVQGADQNHAAVFPSDVHDAVQAGNEWLGQNAGFQGEVVIDCKQ